MPTANKTAESRVKIRFADCDPFNHLNNSRYLDYLLNAREDHLLAEYDFDLYKTVQQTGLGWVVAENRIAYVKPANLMETVTLRSAIIHWGDRTIQVEMQMWNENKTELKALLWTNFVYYDFSKGKPAPHAADLAERFRPLVLENISGMDFNERVQQLKALH